MKREKYYDFLWDWNGSGKGSEFKNKSKEYLDFLARQHSDISSFAIRPSDPDFNNYRQGTLSFLSSAIETIKCFLDSDRPHEHYLDFFWAIMENFSGQLRATSDMYKGLNNLTQSMLALEQGGRKAK